MLDEDLAEFREIANELREGLWRDPFCRKKFSLMFLVDMLLVGRTTEEALQLGYDVLAGVEYGLSYFVFNESWQDFRDFLKLACCHHKPYWFFPEIHTDFDEL